MRTLLISLLTIVILPLSAAPRQALVPGGVAIIELDSSDENSYQFRSKPVLITEIGGIKKAIIGLSLNLKPGEYQIKNSGGSSIQKKYFLLKDKQYTTQNITIENKRKVNPYASDMTRILAEKARKRKASNHYSQSSVDVDFMLPLKGINTGSFGRRRVFNGQPRRPHSGMDIAADNGTPIIAPSGGRVIELGDFFFSGNLIYLDHGQGMISLFAHLSEIDVELGEHVSKGQVIGKVGATGRVTGPHLHWSLGLNGTWIDPALFIEPEAKSLIEN